MELLLVPDEGQCYLRRHRSSYVTQLFYRANVAAALRIYERLHSGMVGNQQRLPASDEAHPNGSGWHPVWPQRLLVL